MRFRRTLRDQQRVLATQYLAFQDKAAEDAKLADPNVPQRVKDSILSHREWAAKAAMPAVPKKLRFPHMDVRVQNEEWAAKHGVAAKRKAPKLDAPHKPLEREIQKAIIEALRLHPRVIKVVRFNSGGSMHRDGQGREHLVMFSSEPVPDLFGLLRNPPGFFWMEVKRPPFSGPRDAREVRQAAFLAAVREAGGIGQFCRSVDEALEAIR